MENKIKKINNHFIQKAFAKNFSNFGILNYTYYEPNAREGNEKTSKVSAKVTVVHPIVKKYVYSTPPH